MRQAKVRDIIILALVLLLGSFFVFFATNCFITIIFNYEANWHFPYIFAVIPHLIFAIEFVTFLIFFTRYLRCEEEYRKHLVKVYAWQFIVHSLIGLVMTILGGTVSYHNFLINNPYPGVLIVCLLTNIVIGALAAFVLIKVSINGKEELKKPMKVSHVFFTIGASLFTFFAFNRFGAFLWSFIYMDYSRFWFTLPFYLSLLVPIVILFAFINPVMGIKAKSFKRAEFIIWPCILLFSLCTCLYVVLIGAKDPSMTSLTSAAMPISRIATKPIDGILLYGVNILMPLGRLIYLAIHRKELD